MKQKSPKVIEYFIVNKEQKSTNINSECHKHTARVSKWIQKYYTSRLCWKTEWEQTEVLSIHLLGVLHQVLRLAWLSLLKETSCRTETHLAERWNDQSTLICEFGEFDSALFALRCVRCIPATSPEEAIRSVITVQASSSAPLTTSWSYSFQNNRCRQRPLHFFFFLMICVRKETHQLLFSKHFSPENTSQTGKC